MKLKTSKLVFDNYSWSCQIRASLFLFDFASFHQPLDKYILETSNHSNGQTTKLELSRIDERVIEEHTSAIDITATDCYSLLTDISQTSIEVWTCMIYFIHVTNTKQAVICNHSYMS